MTRDTGTYSQQPEPGAGAEAPVPTPNGQPQAVLVHLSGGRRGFSQRLSGDVIRVGTAQSADVRLESEPIAVVADEHGTLVRQDNSYELIASAGCKVWVNGELVEHAQLASGDILEFGKEGPVLRFRLYPQEWAGYKSVRDVFADCVECVQNGQNKAVGRMGRARTFLRIAPRELATQTSLWFRSTVVIAVVILALGLIVQTRRSKRLEELVAMETTRIQGLAQVLEKAESRLPTLEELAIARDQLEEKLSSAVERLAVLEERSEAAKRVIAAAAPSVVFLQGAYGFADRSSGKPLRYAAVDSSGRPQTGRDGEPIVGASGNGPEVQAFFTGTAFVASDTGLLLTNRHLALPWEFDPAAQAVIAQGLLPKMRRFIGYSPQSVEAFNVEFVAASDRADLAVLRCGVETSVLPALELSQQPPEPGTEVFILGYPAGIRAFLARTDEQVVQQIMRQPQADFWSVTASLSKGGLIAPLASRGIVGQVTNAAVVYDAETTQGGSGGPVLDLTGEVVAVNAAILPEFGGSNIGVPVSAARELLDGAGKIQARLASPHLPLAEADSGGLTAP
jgi:S1-C subfamily serine protease